MHLQTCSSKFGNQLVQPQLCDLVLFICSIAEFLIGFILKSVLQNFEHFLRGLPGRTYYVPV